MSACLAGVITGASLQLEQLTEALTYKDRSTHMEGCQKTLTLQRVFLLFLVNFLLVKQQGMMVPMVSSQPHSCWCCSHQHSTCLGPLAHLRLNPKPALTAPTQAPTKAQLWPSDTAWRNCGRQEGADKHTTPSQDCDPLSQTESQTSGSSLDSNPEQSLREGSSPPCLA